MCSSWTIICSCLSSLKVCKLQEQRTGSPSLPLCPAPSLAYSKCSISVGLDGWMDLERLPILNAGRALGKLCCRDSRGGEGSCQRTLDEPGCSPATRQMTTAGPALPPVLSCGWKARACPQSRSPVYLPQTV